MELISKVLKKSLRARQFILKIMSKELAKPRTSKKNNQPVLKTISVTPAQRSKFAGVGGINLKKIASKTGVTLSAIDETSFRLFAPNNSALAEAEEMINQLINQPVCISLSLSLSLSLFLSSLLKCKQNFLLERTRARLWRHIYSAHCRSS